MPTCELFEGFSAEGPFPRVFGPYVLINHLGEGGMGRVYLALTRAKDGEHIYVVKRFGNPRSHFTAAQILENQKRFRREAEITMALSHPCIVRTFKSVHQDSASYLVQEFIHGLTIDRLISSMTTQRIPIPLGAHITAQIAGALHYLHEFRGLGLVHRDLTPSNVMFSRDGEVKVIDFGIAKATSIDDTLTQPHIVVGKPLWTAPEVVEGSKPDRRADLYALGLLFWYLLSGRNPEADLDTTTPSLLPPSTFNPEVSAYIDGIVIKAVHRDPDRRFQTAQEFLDQITPLIPQDYQGSKELARFVVGYQLIQENEYFAGMLAEARPLLDQVRSPPSSFSKNKLFLLAITAIVAALAIALALPRGADNHPVPPALPSPSPLLASERPLPPQIPKTPILIPPPTPSSPPTAHFLPDQAPSQSPPRSPSRHSPRRPSQPQPAATTPSPPLPSPSAEDLLASAMDSFQRTELPRTLALARASANLRPTSEAYILIARALFESDPPGAHAALDTALRLSPGNRQAIHLLDTLERRSP